MPSNVPDKRMANIPTDAAFAAGRPVAGTLFGTNGIAGAVRHLYELVTNSAVPGETTMTNDGTEEWLMPQDHSGQVGDYYNGKFLGRMVASGQGMRHPAVPGSLSGWAMIGVGSDHGNYLVGNEGFNLSYGSFLRCLLAYEPSALLTAHDSKILYLCHHLVDVRRGTNKLDVTLDLYAIEEASAASDITIYCGAYNITNWPSSISATDSESLVINDESAPQLVTDGSNVFAPLNVSAPTNSRMTFSLDVSSTGATLLADTQMAVIIGVKFDGDNTNDRCLYYYGATISESQV